MAEQAKQRGRVQEFDPAYVSKISEAVYRARLIHDGGGGAVERMIEKDGDGGTKLRNRSAAYDVLTRCYLRVLNSNSDDRVPDGDGGSGA